MDWKYFVVMIEHLHWNYLDWYYWMRIVDDVNWTYCLMLELTYYSMHLEENLCLESYWYLLLHCYYYWSYC